MPTLTYPAVVIILFVICYYINKQNLTKFKLAQPSQIVTAGSEIKDRPLVRDYQIVPRTSKYYNSVVRWTTEFIRMFSGTTWCYKS